MKETEEKISDKDIEFKVPVEDLESAKVEGNATKEEIKKPEASETVQSEKAENGKIEEKKTTTPEKIKEDRERMEKERKEQERKRKELFEFAKKNEEEFKKIWFNLRKKSNKLRNINTIIRQEEEKINILLSKDKAEYLVSNLKLDFLRDKNLMNDEKKNISFILDQGSSKENIEIVKDMLQELVKKYDNYKTDIARIDKNIYTTTGPMSSVFKELKDKDIFAAVPDHNKEAEAISGEEFENLDKTTENIEKEIEAEKVKLLPAEAK